MLGLDEGPVSEAAGTGPSACRCMAYRGGMSDLSPPTDARPPMPSLADVPVEHLSTDFGVAWVVHDIVSRGDSTEKWAWCKIAPDGEPGYQEIIAMELDGVTRVAFPPGGVLGKVIVKLWC